MRIILFSIISLTVFAEDNFYKDRERGWFWGETIKQKGKTPKELLKIQGKKWENSVATAVLNPTDENIRDYIVKTERITSQAERFAKAFEKFIWLNPKYDYSIENPTSSGAIMAKNIEKRKEMDLKIKDIANSYGILFFFSSTCSVCHRFAPILKKLEKKFNITILAISNDGRGIKEYPQFKKNYFLGKNLNMSVTPSTYLINPYNDEVTPIGFGFSDYEELKLKLIEAYLRIKNV